METRFIASALGLLVTGVDAFVTRKGESEYVWTGPFKLTRVRFLYILARYLALVIHITDISFSIIMVAKFSRAKLVPESFCMSMLVFQSVSSQSMLLVLHSILMLRVFALYNRSVILGALLSFLLIAKFAGVTSMVLHGLITSPRVLRFSGPCLNEMAWTHGHPFENPFVIFIFGELVTQVILHGLAWKRTFWDFRLVSSSRPPLLSVLNRDGFTVFMGIAVAMIAMSVSAVKKGMGVVFVFPLWMAFLSVSGTRTILNLQTLYPLDDSLRSRSSTKAMELTTFTAVSSWSTVWDTATFPESDTEHWPHSSVEDSDESDLGAGDSSFHLELQ